MAVDVGTAKGYLDLDISKFTSALTQANAAASTQMNTLSSTFSTGLNSIGGVMTSAGSTLTKTVTAPVVAMGTAAIKTTADFDKSMSNVQALSGATGKDFDALRKKAIEMGSKTSFSASESADALGYMALAGWDTNQMLGGLEGIMNLAAAGGSDLATTSDIVTDALTAFGLEAKDSGHFADVMAKAMSKSNTSTEQLGEAFKYVAPVAGALGYSVEDVTTALGLMANVGVKGSSAGTSLRQALNSMISPTDEAAAKMDELGIKITNADGTMKPLSEVMDILREKMGGLSEEEQAQAASTIFGTRAMSGMLGIINASESDYQKLTNEINNADGAAKEMADTMLNNLSGQLTILKSALEGLAIQIGDILMPYISKFVSWVQQLVEKFSALSTEEKEQIIRIALIAAAIGPVLLIFGKLLTGVATMIKTFQTLKTGITALKSGFSLLGGAIGGISAPVVAIVAVIGVLVAAFATLWKTNEDFRNKMTGIWDGIKAKFEAFGQGIVDRLNALGFDFQNFAEVVGAVWKGFCDLLAPIFEGVFNQISNILGTVLNVILGIFDIFIGLFTGNWEQAWTGVKEIFSAIWEFIKGTFESWAIAFRGVADTVLGWFGTNWETVWTAVSTFFTNIWNGIKSFFSTVMNTIKTVATTVWTAISTFFTTIWNAIKLVFTTVVNAIKSFLSSAWNAIKTTITTIFTAISTFFTTIWNAIKTVITTVVNAIKTTISTVFNAIKTIITTVLNAISTFITTIWNAIKATITNVVNSIQSTISSVFNAIKTTITTIMNAVSSFITTIWNSIKSTVTSVVEGIKSAVSTAFTNMKSAVTTTINSLKTTITNVFNGIKSAISGAMESAKSSAITAMQNAKDGVVNVWNNIKSTFVGIGKNIIQGIIDGIGAMVSSLYDSIKNALSGLVDKAKDALGIESPSKVFRKEVGSWIPAGIAEGVDDKMGEATKDIQKTIDENLSKVDAEVDPTVSVNDNVSNVVTSFQTAYDGLVGWFESIEERINTSINNMREQLAALIDQGQLVVNGDGTIDYVGYNGSVATRTGRQPSNTSTTDASQRTYVFYSPKAIDEIEAAKQIKKTERDIAEGFM